MHDKRLITQAVLCAVVLSFGMSGCGSGGGGGNGASVSSVPPPPAPPPPPPPPSYEVNQNFGLNPRTLYSQASGYFLADSVLIGDVTGDKRPDVVLITQGSGIYIPVEYMNQVMVYPQLQDGTLGSPIKAAYFDQSLYGSGGSTLGDVDGDGVLEVVVGDEKGIAVAKFNSVTQQLEVKRTPSQRRINAVAAIDINGDGKSEVIAQGWDDGATLYKYDASLGFQVIGTLATPLLGYNAIVASDMNRDGRADLIMTNGQGYANWWVMLADGKGSFGSAQANPIPRRPSDNAPWSGWGVAAGDFNHDGRKDVAATFNSNSPAGIGIYLSQTDGSYSLNAILDSYDTPEPIAVADLDGNGLDDILTVHAGYRTLGYYLQGPSGFMPEKLVGITDMYHPTSHYRPNGLALGDINSDGCVDVAIADNQEGLIVLTGSGCKK